MPDKKKRSAKRNDKDNDNDDEAALAALPGFEAAAAKGDRAAAVFAARLHRLHTKDYDTARRLAESVAGGKDSEAAAAIYQLGLMAFNGEGERKSPKKAYKLHEKAARLGDPDAMFELYVLLSTGQGVDQDDGAALDWNKKAAELGQHRAMYNMGAFHASGRGLKKDMALAMKWYRRAAEAGNGKAAGTLSAMILHEKGPNGIGEAVPFIARALALDFDVGALLEETGVPNAIVSKLLKLAQTRP